ncbi:MAG: DsbC family protein [Gammaproteobacteria bacterium]|nr:DsbC family protein [Gammaproteobacteria bacterium]
MSGLYNKSSALLLSALLLCFTASAADPSTDDDKSSATEDRAQALERISGVLRARVGVEKIEGIQVSLVPNMYEVFLPGSQMIYVSADGRYLFQGAVLDMLTDTNLSDRSKKAHDAKMAPVRAGKLNDYPDEQTIVYTPEDPTYTVTVATDVSCGYCRKFHREIPQLLEAGIKVRYLIFPRAGLKSNNAAYSTMVSVWCAKDSADALTRAKAGQRIEPAECENPIAEHYRMAQEMGVNGTPTIFTSAGRIIPGYMPANELIENLKREAAAGALPVSSGN